MKLTWPPGTEVPQHSNQRTWLHASMLGEYFQVRRLLWDDIRPHIRPSEAEELSRTIGIHVIEENEQLRQELIVLVDILSEFQQQSDCIRDALMERRCQLLPEPPGRSLLLEKVKLLAHELKAKNAELRALNSQRDRDTLNYVLSADQNDGTQTSPPSTPRMSDIETTPSYHPDALLLRPGTSNSKRPSTATSLSRPISRGSTASVSSSSASSIVESPEMRKRLNVDEIDTIREDVQDALLEEKSQLLEDIDFIQGCIDMEQELLDDDRRRISAARPPPSLQDLQDLRRTLEKTLEDHDKTEQLEALLNKTQTSGSLLARRASRPLTSPGSVLPSPPPRAPILGSLDNNREFSREVPTTRHHQDSNVTLRNPMAKVLKIRHVIQEARDEPFLT